VAEKKNRRSIRKKQYILSWFKIVLIGILLLSPSSYYLFSRYSSIFSENTWTNRSFILIITLTFENDSPQGKIWNLSEMEKTVGLFMNNSWQTVYLLNASYPIDDIQIDADGNPIASLSFPTSTIPSGENLTLQVAYKIVLKPRSLPAISVNQSGVLDEIPEELKKRYCRDNGPWQMSREEIRKLAYEIAGNETNVLLLLKKFILWIKKNLEYESQDLPRYPIETLSVKAGDCDDQANLLVAFCRTIGIPAYLQIGCVYLPQRDSESAHWNDHWMLKLTRIGWHGWAMVYVPPWGWVPVDLTFASGILADPINAIRNAAIIVRAVAQYANITETDYVASSRIYREFLLSNGFKIYEHDVLFEETEKHPGMKRLRPPGFYMLVRLSVSSSKAVQTTPIRIELIYRFNRQIF